MSNNSPARRSNNNLRKNLAKIEEEIRVIEKVRIPHVRRTLGKRKNNANRNVNRLQSAKNELERRIRQGGRSGFFSRGAPAYNAANNRAKLNKVKSNLANAVRVYRSHVSAYGNRIGNLEKKLRTLESKRNSLVTRLTPMEAYARLEGARRQYENSGWGAWTRPT